MNTPPKIEVLAAIRPENAGTGEDTLVYSDLQSSVERQAPFLATREHDAWQAQPDTLEELSAVRQLASQYFLMGAARGIEVANDESKDLWAGRFTQATIELYGNPEKEEVQSMINEEFANLLKLQDDPSVSQTHLNFLLETYRPLIIPEDRLATGEKLMSDETALSTYGSAISEKYAPLFDMIDKDDYASADLADLFDQALIWLAENDDPDWAEWKTLRADGTMLSVLSSKKAIKIANQRPDADASTTKGLIAHELLVHALRAVRGAKTSEPRMTSGLPGYLETEEGLGIVAEAAITGIVPSKAYDRYVDVALALGIVDGRQRTRKDLFEISFARQLIRKQTKGEVTEAAEQELRKGVWGHIDRLYRGGLGDESTINQAVFTKDIAYYAGYKKMINYIKEQLSAGKKAAEIFDYLSMGKFDPTNPQHTAIVEEL